MISSFEKANLTMPEPLSARLPIVPYNPVLTDLPFVISRILLADPQVI
jgi:hypothetical protein